MICGEDDRGSMFYKFFLSLLEELEAGTLGEHI
jgi:hypothetical protein